MTGKHSELPRLKSYTSPDGFVSLFEENEPILHDGPHYVIAREVRHEWAPVIVHRVNTWEKMRDALEAALEYFEDRSDADHDGTRFIANEEMHLSIVVEAALKLAKGD